MVMTMDEAYRILGVPRDSSPDQIKSAYKKLALKTHPDKNKSEDAHEMFQKVSEAYKRIIDPESFKDDEFEMDDTDINQMFQEVFSEMFRGGEGGIPFSILEMMMAQEMGMGDGYFDHEDDEYDDYDDDEDEMYHSHEIDMHDLAAMMAQGFRHTRGCSHHVDYEDDEDELLDEDDYGDDMDNISPEMLQHILMKEMLGGGIDMRNMKFELEDMIMMQAMANMGMDVEYNGYDPNRRMNHGRNRPDKSNIKSKKSSSKASNSSQKNLDSTTAGGENWITDSDDEDEEDKKLLAKGVTDELDMNDDNQKKKPGANAKKNKRKARNKKLKKAMAKGTNDQSTGSDQDSSNPGSKSPNSPNTAKSFTQSIPTTNKSNLKQTPLMNTKQDTSQGPPIHQSTSTRSSSSTTEESSPTSQAASTPAFTPSPIDTDVDTEMRKFMSTLRTRKSPGETIGVGAGLPLGAGINTRVSDIKSDVPVAVTVQTPPLVTDNEPRGGATEATIYPYKIGDRIQLVGKNRTRGAVAFVGKVHYAEGVFVGVVMDQPLGKNNGTVKGKRYFTCSADRGLMLRLEDVALAT